MSKLNVLVLHRMGDPRYRREAVRSLEYMIPACRPDLNCIVHDADIPFPEYLKNIDYHLIILGPTFLCSRYYSNSLELIKKEYEFIGESHACKIAMPQDDYDCSGILDEWMVSWNISRIYTVCPEHWEVLYPHASKNIEIRLGYTSYISDKWIDSWRYTRNHVERSIDVSYRASKLTANFGKVGQLKWQIAERFKSAVKSRITMNLDISVDPKDLILGSRWHKFLEDSKFCLATPSGSSLLDPYNSIRKCVNKYLSQNPNATFDEIEKYCFSGLDSKYLFLAISPRNLEAALSETVQIATAGSYSGLMSPGKQFILLDENCRNIDDVLRMMKDELLINKLRRQCKETILDEPRLRQKNIVNEIITFAEDHISKKNHKVRNQEKIDQAFAYYRSEIHRITKLYWMRKRLVQNIKYIAVTLGARRVRDFSINLFR